jgi:cytochrome c oxidase cbb3-type subunit 3
MTMAGHKHIDEVTGVETTGHVWDGDLCELNKPLPKWWLYVFYACCVWAFGYWMVYPAWPTLTGYTQGYLGYSQRAAVTAEINAAKAAQDTYRQAIANTPITEVKGKEDLMQFAMAGGAAAFGDNCSGCHGRGAQGALGYPNLNDDDWIWGGTVEQIEQTIAHGIRNGEEQARNMMMPRFGLDGILEPAVISDVAHYVRSMSGSEQVDAAAAERGKATFAEQCAACHGEDGKGNQEMGAPNLSDAIWLYGGSQEAVTQSIVTGRGGAMPAWAPRLDPVTVKMLAVYVHALGGGK